MLRTLKGISVLLIILAIFQSCDEPIIPAPLPEGKKYIQQEVGSYIVYQVDSIHYNDFTFQIDTFSYQIKEVVESEFVDLENDTALRIERYFRWNDTDQWLIKDVWQANLYDHRYEKVEENVRYVRLAFPISDQTEWDGNSKNIRDEQIYYYDEIEEPYSINAFSTDSSISVIHIDFKTLIGEDYGIEVYAKNIGMIYKNFTALALDATNGDIVSGVKYEYSMIDYGHE